MNTVGTPALVVTFAELGFLLSTAEEEARQRLRLPATEPLSPIVASGLASLVARGLLRVANDVAVPREELVPLLDAITSPSAWVEIGFARGETGASIQVFDGPRARYLAVARPLGTFEFSELDRTISFSKATRALVQEFLGEQPGAVFLKNDPTDLDGFAVGRTGSGEFQVALGPVDGARTVSADMAFTEVETYIGF